MYESMNNLYNMNGCDIYILVVDNFYCIHAFCNIINFCIRYSF